MDIQQVHGLNHAESLFTSIDPIKSFRDLRTIAQNMNMRLEPTEDPNDPSCHFILKDSNRNLTVFTFGVLGDTLFNILVTSTSEDTLQQILNQIEEIASLTEVPD